MKERKERKKRKKKIRYTFAVYDKNNYQAQESK